MRVTSQVESERTEDSRKVYIKCEAYIRRPIVDQSPTEWWNAGQSFAMLTVAQKT